MLCGLLDCLYTALLDCLYTCLTDPACKENFLCSLLPDKLAMLAAEEVRNSTYLMIENKQCPGCAIDPYYTTIALFFNTS